MYSYQSRDGYLITIMLVGLGAYELDRNMVLWEKHKGRRCSCLAGVMYVSQTQIDQLMKLSIHFRRAHLQLLTNERSSKKWFHNPNSQEPERRSVKTRGYRPCRRQSGWLGQDDVTQSSWGRLPCQPLYAAEESRYWEVNGMGAMPCRQPSLFFAFGWGQAERFWKLLNHFGSPTTLHSLFEGGTWHWSRQESHDGCLGT